MVQYGTFYDQPGKISLLLAGAIMLVLMGMTLMAYSFQIRRRDLTRRLRLIEGPPSPRQSAQDASEFPARPFSTLQSIGGAMSERDQREVARRLFALHIPAHFAARAFLVIRLGCVAGLGLGAFMLGTQLQLLAGRSLLNLLLALMFAITGWFVPALVIGRLAKARAKKAVAGLPDALELLVVCVEGGLALEDSIDRMVLELRHSNAELADEFSLTSADIKFLPNREQALMKLADRLDVPSVRSVVTTLSQSMRYGTPLAQAMRVVATEIRDDSLIAMEERANRLPTLMTLPMMLFIMPTIFLIVGGPAALRIIDAFLQ